MSEFTALETTWILLCAFMVLLMQAGFCLFEAGLVRSKNSINVAFKNLSDFTVAALTYWFIGFSLMYGSSNSGLIGNGEHLFGSQGGSQAWFIYQLMFCGAAATIVGGALAERTRFVTYLCLSIVMAGLIYPVAGHWVWAMDSLGNAAGWLGKLGFVDFAGSSVVHGVGGWVALAAVIVVGARIGRFPEQKPDDEHSGNNTSSQINASSYPLATVGVILLWFGWFGFNAGSAVGSDIEYAKIIVNTCLAAAAGSVTLVALHLFQTGKPDIGSTLNGTLAGLVGVTAGCHVFSEIDSLIVGAIAAICALLATKLLERFKIDDVISAFPVHAIAGLVGTLLVAVLGDSTFFPNGNDRFSQFGIQLTGAVAIGIWAFATGFIFLSVINRFSPARVTADEEIRGLNVSEHNATTETVELLTDMSSQRERADFSTPVAVEPHTEVGQIAHEYNQVLERVRLEIETREQAYKQLKQASHFQYIFENTDVGILQFGLDGEIQRANPAAAHILGYASVDRLLTQLGPFMQHLQHKNPSASNEIQSKLQEIGQISDLPIEYQRVVDSKTGYASISIRSIPSQKDQAPCYLASISDQRDKRENERLRVARNSAESANKAKSQFLANMSHEIRTPLNGVTGMLELLSRSELEEHQRQYISIAQNSAQSLLSVINDILDFSKIEAGKMELDSVEFRLSDTLADVVDMFASQTARKNIELIGNIQPTMPEWVVGDPERLRQVLINLLGNAVKFTEEGHIALTALSTKQSDRFARFQITIEDSGCGISKENQQKLFKSFTQADSSTTRKYGGTGLGLTISRQLVELMKGSISMTSELGKGSKFTITIVLPLSDRKSEMPQRLPSSVSGTNILVVDDHPVNIRLMIDLLKPFGVNVESASSGQHALEVLDQAAAAGKPFELCLLDYHMPEMDGIGLAKQIRSRTDHPALKLIMLTSIDQVTITDPGMDNFDALLVKPVRASRLFDSIMTALADKFVGHVDPSGRDTAQQAAQAGSAVHGTDTASVTILLAEDNPVNQLVASKILKQAKYNVEVVSDGQKAVERLEKGGIDIILMDCQMPVLDGFEATRKIRRDEKSRGVESERKIPIVALTANALKGDRELCLAAGMDDYVTKPLQLEKLFEVLSRFVATPGDSSALGHHETGDDDDAGQIPLQNTGT